MCDGVLYPRMTAGEAAPWARSGRVPGPAPPQDGRPAAVSPDTGLVGPTQLVGPGPVAVLLQCIQSLERGPREK